MQRLQTPFGNYCRPVDWGYEHQNVCHSKGEYARDEDGDGFHQIHVNMMDYEAGCVPTGAFPRKLCRSIWPF